MDEAWLQDYDKNMKDNRQFAHKMTILQQQIGDNPEIEPEPEKLTNLEKLKLLEGTADTLLWGVSIPGFLPLTTRKL